MIINGLGQVEGGRYPQGALIPRIDPITGATTVALMR